MNQIINKLTSMCCGCGNPEKFYRCILKILTRADNEGFWLCSDEEFVIINMLWYLGLTDHGGSVYGSWLSREGEIILNWLKTDPDICDLLEIRKKNVIL